MKDGNVMWKSNMTAYHGNEAWKPIMEMHTGRALWPHSVNSDFPNCAQVSAGAVKLI